MCSVWCTQPISKDILDGTSGRGWHEYIYQISTLSICTRWRLPALSARLLLFQSQLLQLSPRPPALQCRGLCWINFEVDVRIFRRADALTLPLNLRGLLMLGEFDQNTKFTKYIT